MSNHAERLREMADSDAFVFGRGHTEREAAFLAGADALELLALASSATPLDTDHYVRQAYPVSADRHCAVVERGVVSEATEVDARYGLAARLISTALKLMREAPRAEGSKP